MDKKLKATIKYLVDIKSVSEMTPKKLQKMLYYCYSWHLALTAENEDTEEILSSRLFDATFEAWAHGPVIPEVYNAYKKNKYTVIEESGIDIDVDEFLNVDEIDSIEQVVEVYGDLNGNQLEQISHSEEPWIIARGDAKPLDICTNKIDDFSIYSFYSAQLV
jgi:hypothetical protein